MPSYTAGKPQSGPALFVEPGEYSLRVVEAKDKKSGAGNAMIELRLRVVMEDGSDGPSLFDYLVFTPKAYFKIDAFQASCGRHPGEGQDSKLDADDCVGLECRARLKVEEYEGRKNNKVDAYIWEEEGF